MSLKKINFNEGANIDASCLNNMQSSMDKFLVSHKHDGIEAPFVDAKEISTNNLDINSYNKTLYDHVRDYSIHNIAGGGTPSNSTNDQLDPNDYVEIDIIDQCVDWTFNGVYWETYVKLSQSYSGDYSVKVQPVYAGSYSDFFNSLNPEASLANLDSVIPLNNTLLNIHIVPTNLSDEGFEIRVYAIGQGTRHQLTPYNESFLANKTKVYNDEDITLPISGNIATGSFQLPYKGGFNFLPKSGALSISVDLLLNISANVTAEKSELIIGEDVQALPFNIGQNEFYAFSESIIGGTVSGTYNTEVDDELKAKGLLTNTDIESFLSFGPSFLTKEQQKNLLTEDNETVKYRKRSFTIVDINNNDAFSGDLIELKRSGDINNYYVIVTETEIDQKSEAVDPKVRELRFLLSDVDIVSNNIIKVSAGKGNLVPRAVDSYGNIEYSNVYLQGDYVVVDDEYIQISNATFNGIPADQLFYEPEQEVYLNVLEGSSAFISDIGSVSISYDRYKILNDVLPMIPATHLTGDLLEYKTSPSNISSYPSLQIEYKDFLTNWINAKQSNRYGFLCKKIKVRPSFFNIAAGANYIIPERNNLRFKKNIILMKEDLNTAYAGDQERFTMKAGRKSNINRAEVFQPLNRLSYQTPDLSTHFFTILKWPKLDGKYQEAFAEVINNTIINYTTADAIDFTQYRYIDRYRLGNRFDGIFQTYKELEGSLHSYIDDSSNRVYYIRLTEEPSDAIVYGLNGSKIKLTSMNSDILNYIDSEFSNNEIASKYSFISGNGPFASLVPDIGIAKSKELQEDGSWRLYLYSPADVGTGDSPDIVTWEDVVYLDKALDSNYFPVDVVNISGEPIFLYKNAKEPVVLNKVYCTSSGTITVNKTTQIKNNDYEDIAFGFNSFDEDSTADAIEHYIYLGLDVPFNRINAAMESGLSSTLLSVGTNVEYEYFAEDGNWTSLTVLTSTNNLNDLWNYDPNLATIGSNSLSLITFARPNIQTGSNKWIRSTIDEYAIDPKYWIRIKVNAKDHGTLDWENRKDLFPSFKSLTLSSIAEAEIIISGLTSPDGIAVLDSPDRTITIDSVNIDDIDWSDVRPGDMITWREFTSGAYRSSTITSLVESSPTGTVTISFDDTPAMTDDVVDWIHIRKNPFAFLRNINFNEDRHVNSVEARENKWNPFDPYSSSGFNRSPAYSINKQQWIIESNDAEPDYTNVTTKAIRGCFDDYGAQSYSSYDVDKFNFSGTFLATDIAPVINASSIDDIIQENDTLRINQKLWVNSFPPTNSPSNDYEMYFYVCRPVDEDRYYLVVLTNDASLIPSSEETLSTWNLGVFDGKAAYIWNENPTVLSRDYPYALPSGSPDTVYTFDLDSLDFNQRIERFHKGKADSFGGRDVIGFSFDTNDIFESYDVTRPGFYGIAYQPDGKIWPHQTGSSFVFDDLGYTKLVLPINVSIFGDIFKNYYEGDPGDPVNKPPFYYSDPRGIMTKEYATGTSAYRVNLLEFVGDYSYKLVDDVILANNDFDILLSDTDRATALDTIQHIYSGDYDEMAILIDTNNENYLDTRIAVGRTYDPDSIANDPIDVVEKYSDKFIKSRLSVDLGKNADATATWQYYVPVRYNLLKELDTSVSNLTINDIDFGLGDGLYCLRVPLENIRHYDSSLEGTIHGVAAKRSDSYLSTDDLFVEVGSPDTVENTYEIAAKRDLTNPEKSLIWTLADFDGRSGIHIANWGYATYDNGTSVYDWGVLNKFIAAGDYDPNTMDRPLFETATLKSDEKLVEFLEGSSVFLRVYRVDDWNSPDGNLIPTYNEAYKERFLGVIDNVSRKPFNKPSSEIANKFKNLTFFSDELIDPSTSPDPSVLVDATVISRTTATPPGGASPNDAYIIPFGATGAWAGQDGKLAVWNGAGWDITSPARGWYVTVDDEGGLQYVFTDAYASGGFWTSNYNTGENEIPDFADMILYFKEEGDSIYNIKEEVDNKQINGGIMSSIIDYNLQNEIYDDGGQFGRYIRSWSKVNASSLRNDIDLFSFKSGATASGDSRADLTGQIEDNFIDLFSEYTNKFGVFRLIRNSFDSLDDYGIRVFDGTAAVGTPMTMYNYNSVPYYAPTLIQNRFYDSPDSAEWGHMSHHYVFTLVFRKAKDDVHNIISILKDPARSWLSGHKNLSEKREINAGPYYENAGYANSQFDFAYQAPSMKGANANLLQFVYKTGTNIIPIRKIIEADDLDAYYSGALTTFTSNLDPKSLNTNGYDILVGSDANEANGTIEREVTFVDPSSMDFTYVKRPADEAENIVLVLSVTSPNDPTYNSMYPGQAVIRFEPAEDTSPEMFTYADLLTAGEPSSDRVLGYIKNIEWFGRYNSGGITGNYYKVNMRDGVVIEPGTYKLAFWYIPLITKVPEDYTRHNFDISDYRFGTIYTNNMQFNYNLRKVVYKNNKALYERDNIKINL